MELSKDGVTWLSVFQGSSAGNTNALQRLDLPPHRARWLRIVGYGNSENDWNSITEVEILGSP